MAWYWWIILVSFAYLSIGLVCIIVSKIGGMIIGLLIDAYDSPWGPGPTLGWIVGSMIVLVLMILMWPVVAWEET